jgi:hypothetical protein
MERDEKEDRAEAWLRAEAQRCFRLAEVETTPNAARLLRNMAREYEARAAALHRRMPCESRFPR